MNYEITDTGLCRGVVYSYTNTTDGEEYGWAYIGETPNEKTRRKSWRDKSDDYAGRKIANARKFYGLAAFKYDVVEEIITKTPEELQVQLREREKHWIAVYDSENTGYNTNRSEAAHKVAVYVTTTEGEELYYKSMTDAAIDLGRSISYIWRWSRKKSGEVDSRGLRFTIKEDNSNGNG